MREAYERALELPEAEQERLGWVLDPAIQLTNGGDRDRPEWAGDVVIQPSIAITPEERRAAAEALLRSMREHPGSSEPGWKFN